MSTNQNPIFDQIEQAAQATNKFLKIQPGQPIVLKFDNDKIRLVDREINGKKSKAVEYDVAVQDATGWVQKVVTFSMSWALNLNELLKEGKTQVKIVRRGSGLDTSYTFIAV